MIRFEQYQDQLQVGDILVWGQYDQYRIVVTAVEPLRFRNMQRNAKQDEFELKPGFFDQFRAVIRNGKKIRLKDFITIQQENIKGNRMTKHTPLRQKIQEAGSLSNQIVIPNMSDINHTRITKWLYGNIGRPGDYRFVRVGNDGVIDTKKLSPRDISDIKNYLRSQGHINESGKPTLRQMIREAVRRVLRESAWSTNKDSQVTYRGQPVVSYEFDRDSDSFWTDDYERGRGQISHETKEAMIRYIEKMVKRGRLTVESRKPRTS